MEGDTDNHTELVFSVPLVSPENAKKRVSGSLPQWKMTKN